jgi:hypothetical protein
LTAIDRMFTPRSSAARPSSLNITCFGILALLLESSGKWTGCDAWSGLCSRGSWA